MTMPHLSNCPHQAEGWCLDCVGELEAINTQLCEQNTEVDAACAKLEAANAELLEACSLFVAYDSNHQSDHIALMLAYAAAIEAARAVIAKHGSAT